MKKYKIIIARILAIMLILLNFNNLIIFAQEKIEENVKIKESIKTEEKLEQEENSEKEKSIELDESINIDLGDVIDLDYKVKNIDEERLIWSTNKEDVIRVKGSEICAVKEGEATVTVETEDKSVKETCKVTVVDRNKNTEKISNKNSQRDTNIIIKQGITYEMVNTMSRGNISLYPTEDSYSYDKIYYDSFGEIKYVYVENKDSIILRPGEKVKFRSDRGMVEFTSYSDYTYSLNKSEEPMLEKLNLTEDTSYEITNKVDSPIIVATNATIKTRNIDAFFYDFDKNETSSNYVDSYGNFKINKNKKLNIGGNSQIETETIAAIPCDYEYEIKQRNNPVFYKFNMEVGKSYEIVNKSDLDNIWTDVDCKEGTVDNIDYAVYYNTDGMGKKDYWETHKSIESSSSINWGLKKGDKKIIGNPRYSDMKGCIAYDYKNLVTIKNNPVLYELNVNENDYYEIYTDGYGLDLDITTDDYDYGFTKTYNSLSYTADGESSYSRVEGDAYDLMISKSYYKTKFDSNNNRLILMLPYELKDTVKKVSTPVFYKIDVELDKSYEFTNKTKLNQSIIITSYEEASYFNYDYATYDEDNNMVTTKINAGDYRRYYEHSTEPNKKIKLGLQTDVDDIKLYLPYESKSNIKTINAPVFEKIKVEKNKNYYFKNNSNGAVIIDKSNTNKYTEFMVVKYDEYGRISYKSDSTSNANTYLDKGEAVSIKLKDYKDKDVYLHVPYELSEKDRPIIKSVKYLKNNGVYGTYDISTSIIKVPKTSKDKKSINIVVDWNGKTRKEVRLQQGVRCVTSKDGIFNIVLGDYFDVDEDIYAVAVSEDGKYSTPVKTKIKIVKGNSTADDDSFTLGNYQVGTAPSWLPFIGGQSFDLNLGKVKFTSRYDESKGTYKFILGTGSSIASPEDFDKKFEKIQKAYDLGQAYGTISGFNIGSTWGFETDGSGYLECESIDGKLKIIKGGIAVNAGLSKNIGSQFMVSIVPVYVKANVGASVGFTSDFYKEAPISYGKLNLSGAFDVNPSVQPRGGVGIDQVVSVGLKGSLGISIGVKSLNPNPTFSISGGIGIAAELLGVFSHEVFLGPYTWPSSYKNENQIEKVDLYDENNYKQISREYLDSNSGWLGNKTSSYKAENNEKISLLEDGILPTSEPQIAYVNNKKILVWIRDNKDRSDINRSELVYSIQEDGSSSWSAPKSVYNDNTADLYPQLAYDDNNLYVVWQNIKKVMNENATVNDFAKESEIVVSKFNTNTNDFEKPVNLSNNATYDGMPVVEINNDKVFVAWKNNSQSDLFGQSGTNSIMYSEFDGSQWSNSKVVKENMGSILSMDIKHDDNKTHIVYSIDKDRNSETVADQQVHYLLIENNEVKLSKQISTKNTTNSNPKLVKYNNKIGVLWYEENQIVFKDDVNSSNNVSTINNSTALGTDKFNIIQNNENFAITWIDNSEGSKEVFGIIYDKKANKLSEAVKLTNIDERIKSVSGIYDKNNKLILASNIAQKIENETNGFKYEDDGISSLNIIEIDLAYDLKVSENTLVIDESNFKENIPITFNIENKGQLGVNSVKVEVCEKIISSRETIHSSEIIDLSILPGENKEVTANFTPTQGKQYNLFVRITPMDGKDNDMDDNVQTFKVGYPDLEIKNIYVEDYYAQRKLIGKITNNSMISCNNVVVNIRKNDKDGDILFTKDIGYLENGYSDYNEEDFEYIIEDGYEGSLYIEVKSEEEEIYTSNNFELVTIDKKYDELDTNKDGAVDILDLANIAKNYNDNIESDTWNFKYDINSDLIIDILDLVIISKELD